MLDLQKNSTSITKKRKICSNCGRRVNCKRKELSIAKGRHYSRLRGQAKRDDQKSGGHNCMENFSKPMTQKWWIHTRAGHSPKQLLNNPRALDTNPTAPSCCLTFLMTISRQTGMWKKLHAQHPFRCHSSRLLDKKEDWRAPPPSPPAYAPTNKIWHG